MSSTELFLLPFALMASAAKSPAACPAAVAGERLTSGTVYDGPIAENAILAPDAMRKVGGADVSSWQVGYVYRAGRQVYLSCAYAKHAPVIVRVARPARLCRYTEHGASRSLSCA